MWRWLHNFLYGAPTALVAVPPTEAIAEQQALAEARGRTSLIFDSHIMTEAASSKNPQAVSLAWDEGRAYGFNVAPQNWLGMTPRERKETLLSIFIANPWASNCIDSIALYITSGGYTIEPRVGVENPDERQRDEIDAFLRRINEDWDFDQYVYDQISDRDIFGEAFTEFTMKDGKPYQLFPIDCLTMDTEHDRYGRVIRYKQQLTSTSQVNYLNPQNIVRWWNPHKRAKVDPFSPLEGIQDAILLDKKMTNWTTTFFQKGAKFPYSIEGIADQDEADRFLTWWRANFTGEKNAQTPVVTWGNAKIVPSGRGSIDVDFDKGLDRMQSIVLANFHVPPAIACISETGNRLTDMSDSQRKILQYIACDPRRRTFFEKFNYRLIAPFWSDWYVSSRYADLRDDEKLAKVADIRVRNGTRLIDEVRAEEGRDAYPDGVGQIPVIVVSRDVVPVPRIKDLEGEQRQAAQIAERQAAAAADLAEIKAKQAKEQPDPHGNNREDPGDNQGDDEKSARDPEKKEKEESQNKLTSDILNAFIDDIKRDTAMVVNEADRPEVVQHHTGMMLAFLLDPETAQRLAIPGGELASELHITLAYLGDMEDEEIDGRYRPDTMREPMLRIVSAIASTASPLAGRIAGIGRFHPAETDTTPVLALVDIPGLAEFRSELVAALDQAGYFIADNHGYTPHITLAYIDAAAPTPIETVPQIELNFDTVWLIADDERIPFQLGTPVPPPGENDDAEQETHTQSGETDAIRPGPDQGEGNGTLHQTEEAASTDGGELDRSSATGEGANYTLNLAKIIPRKRWDGPLNYFPPRATLAAKGNQHGEKDTQGHTQENRTPQGEQTTAKTNQTSPGDGMASQFDDQGGDRSQSNTDARRNRGPRSSVVVKPDSRSAEGSGRLEGMAGNESRSAEGREGHQAQSRNDIASQTHDADQRKAGDIADRQKAALATWIADLFYEIKKRGASSSPTLATAISAYSFTDQEQEALAQRLATVYSTALSVAYHRDMAVVGLSSPPVTEARGVLGKFSDLISWGREQVASIVSTMKEQLSTFIGNLKGDSNVAEQVNGWIDRYADYKAPQVANVAWGTGANDGSMQAIDDIMDAATDPSRPKPLDTESIRVRVTPSYSSGDFCADYAGHDYSLNEYLQLGISWPAHPNCRHGIEIIRKDGGEV